MGSGPQSQDVEHQPPPVTEDLRIRREVVRERGHLDQPRQRSQGPTTPRRSHDMPMARPRPGVSVT